MKVALYCGASVGNDPTFLKESRTLAKMVAQKGYDIVYGGSRSGLMGAVADAALEAGAQVYGIEPRFLLDSDEPQHPGITQLIAVETLNERKEKMSAMSDAFVALPGGIGTVDEIVEALALAKLSQHSKPIIVLNVLGCYDALECLLFDLVANGFVATHDLSLIGFAHNAEEAVEMLVQRATQGAS